MKEIQRYCLRETGTLVSNPGTMNSDIPTVSICAYPAFSKDFARQFNEKNISAKDLKFETNFEMMQFYLTHMSNLLRNFFRNSPLANIEIIFI